MRDYAKISPAFWTGQTGRRIVRTMGPEGAALALYLITSQHANMLGIYYLPLAYVQADTGIPLEGALKALRGLADVGFCLYDPDSEWVFVLEMARFQILTDGEPLHFKDKRVLGIQKAYRTLPDNPFLLAFFEKYASFFHLEVSRGKPFDGMPLGRPLHAPPMPGAGAGAGAGAEKTQHAARASGQVGVVTRSEQLIRECFVEKADFIAAHFPSLNPALECEECVAKYGRQSIGADPWLIVLRWLRKSLKVPDIGGKNDERTFNDELPQQFLSHGTS